MNTLKESILTIHISMHRCPYLRPQNQVNIIPKIRTLSVEWAVTFVLKMEQKKKFITLPLKAVVLKVLVGVMCKEKKGSIRRDTVLSVKCSDCNMPL